VSGTGEGGEREVGAGYRGEAGVADAGVYGLMWRVLASEYEMEGDHAACKFLFS
jgi:hypothetical protein